MVDQRDRTILRARREVVQEEVGDHAREHDGQRGGKAFDDIISVFDNIGDD